MSNELIFIISALVDITLVFLASRSKHANWLFGVIIVNLILVGIFGTKLISLFGFTTNAGNVFYACVFLATHFLLERHGKKVGLETIWYGAILTISFALLSQLATNFVGIFQNDEVSSAILTLFSFSLRITFASIIAYTFAQYINISIYEWLKLKTKGHFIGLRSNAANIISQMADSTVFFSIAFFDLSGPLLVQAILAGWIIKTAVVLMGTPFLYIGKYLDRKNI